MVFLVKTTVVAPERRFAAPRRRKNRRCRRMKLQNDFSNE
jgi:hypothetical protein